MRSPKKKKLTQYRYFWVVAILFPVACSRQPETLPTDLPIPTIVSPTSVPPTPVSTSTFIPATFVPTPLPTNPVFPVITPNATQIERWNEYEDALAKAFFNDYFRPEDVVCEWEILGQTKQEVYVWAYCSATYSAGASAGSIPTVIHLRADGSVQSAEIPGDGTAYGPGIKRMFPPDLQDRIFNHVILFEGMEDRMLWRRGHPDEPPLIILNALRAQPTQPVIPLITPSPIQRAKWADYQTALAEGFLSYLSPEEVSCEWEILGQSGQDLYVWAICSERFNVGSLEGLATISVGADGSVQSAASRIDFPDEVRKLYPPEVQNRYFHGLIHYQELVDHLRWRKQHPEEPPLFAANTTP